MSHTIVSTRRIFAVAGLMLAAAFTIPAQQGNPGKTAGEVYKNVPALKDTPSTQFIPAMRYIATALGVECEFCHTGTRSEDTPNKVIARKMIAMTLALNKDNFEGRAEITCFTCHKGTHDPVNNPTPTGLYSTEGPSVFFNPPAPPAGGADREMAEAYRDVMKKEQEAKAATLPKAEQILAKYVTALGGEAALRSVTSRVITSTTELSPNVRGTGPVVYVKQIQYFKAPNLYMTTFQPFTGPQTAKGFDGTAAWTQNANGVVNPPGGSDLARAKRDADLYASINLKDYARLNMRGIEKVGDREAYVVVGVPAGDNLERLYFDTQTGLLLRRGTFNITPIGRYTINTDYSDYRDVGGVKVPFLIKTLTVSPADTTVIHVEKVENNVPVDAGKFTKPVSKPPAAR